MAEDTTFEDDLFAFMSTKDIQRTSCLLDKEISILKEELQRTNLELDSFKEKIKLNKQFPYYVVAWHGTRIEGFIMLKKYQQVHGDLKLRGRLESVSFMEDQI
ncbi:hypothetical protein Tco_0281798 [Tanacetum coccineum]